MSHDQQIKTDILNEISRLKEMDTVIEPRWVANAVTKKYFSCLPHTEDAEVVKFMAFTECRRKVAQLISKSLDASKGDKRELILPGFEYLQTHYEVKRNNEWVGVPINLMTKEEVLQKAEFYKKMGEAVFKHAQELEAYAARIGSSAHG